MNINNSTENSFSTCSRPCTESTGYCAAMLDCQDTSGRICIEKEASESFVHPACGRDTVSAELPVEQNRFQRIVERTIFAAIPRQHINTVCFGLCTGFGMGEKKEERKKDTHKYWNR